MSKRRRHPTPKRGWQPLMVADRSPDSHYTKHGLTPPDRSYVNDRYSVFVREIGRGALHISFHRHDRAAVRDWRHFQAIKNEVAGHEFVALEIFPPESKLVDTANEYHLWALPPGTEIPFMFQGEAFVLDPDEMLEQLGGPTKARQRAWEPGIPTGKGLAQVAP